VVPNRAPLRRNTDPAEVGDAAAFLASDFARGVTCDVRGFGDAAVGTGAAVVQ
jgi:enoyl-[acyl-carrier-protein] reductase (NADH)